MRATDVLIPPRWSPPARPAVTQGLSTRAVAGMKDASGNIIRPDTDGGVVAPVILPPSLPEAPRIEDILVKAPDGWLKGWSIAAEAIVADHISAGAIETTHLAAGAVTTEKIAAGAITADVIDVETLSALSADLGTVTAGIITNPAGTALIDLNATGTNPVFRYGGDHVDTSSVVMRGNGSFRFGALNRNISFDTVDLTLNRVNLVAPAGTLGQLEIASGGHIQSSDYVPDTSGWKLSNDGLEANDGTFRGTVAAGTIAADVEVNAAVFSAEVARFNTLVVGGVTGDALPENASMGFGVAGEGAVWLTVDMTIWSGTPWGFGQFYSIGDHTSRNNVWANYLAADEGLYIGGKLVELAPASGGYHVLRVAES